MVIKVTFLHIHFHHSYICLRLLGIKGSRGEVWTCHLSEVTVKLCFQNAWQINALTRVPDFSPSFILRANIEDTNWRPVCMWGPSIELIENKHKMSPFSIPCMAHWVCVCFLFFSFGCSRLDLVMPWPRVQWPLNNALLPMCLGCGFGPQWGHTREASDPCLSPSFSLPPRVSKGK